MNAMDALVDLRSQPDLEVIDQTEPLESLAGDIQRLECCLKSYQEQLTSGLVDEAAPQRWGHRLTRTTLLIVGGVLAFALVLNVLLVVIRADQQQLLQANCGLGILYALICLLVLNDFSSKSSSTVTQAEALQLRASDVTDQLRELVRTRQTWVEECTRSKWTCETEKLKLQLAETELLAAQNNLQRTQGSLLELHSDIETSEAQLVEMAKEIANRNGQLVALQSQQSTVSDEIKLQDQQRVELTERLAQLRLELQAAEEKHQLVEQEFAQQQQVVAQQWNASRESAEQELAALADAVAAAQQELAQVQDQATRLSEDVSLSEAIVEEQSRKLADVNQALDSAQQTLNSVTLSLDEKRAQQEELGHLLETMLERKLAQDEELSLESQELVALRQQRDTFCGEVHDQQQVIQDLMEKENQLQGHVDWLLGQVGELERLSLAQSANVHSLDDLDASIADKRATLALLGGEEKRLREEIQALSSQTSLLTDQIQARQADLDSLTQSRPALLEELDSLRALVNESREECDRFTTSHRQAMVLKKEELEAVASTLDRQNEQLARLDTACTQAQAQLEEVLSNIALRTTELSQLQEQLQDTLAKRTAAEEGQLAAKAEMDSILQQAGLTSEQLRIEADRLVSFTSDSHALEQQLMQKGQHLEKLSHASIQAQEQLDELLDVLQTKQLAAEQMERMLSEAQHKLSSTEAAQREAEARACTLLEKAESVADQVRARSDELKLADQELREIEEEIRRLETLKAQFDQLNDDSDRLDSRLQAQRLEALELAENITNGQMLESELRSTIAMLSQEHQTWQDRLADIAGEYEQRQAGLHAANDELAVRVDQQAELESELKALRSMIDERSRDLQALEGRIALASDEARSMESQSSELSTHLRQWQDQSVELAALIEEREQLLNGLKAAISDHEQLLKNNLREVDQSAKRREACEAAIERLASDKQKLDAQIESLTSEVNESQTIAAQWRDYMQKLQTDMQKLEAERAHEQRQLDHVRQHISQQHDQLQVMSDELQTARQELNDCLAEQRALEARIKSLRNEIAHDESVRTKVAADLDLAEKHLAVLQDELLMSQRALADSQQECRREQLALQTVKDDYERGWEQRNRLQTEIDELHNVLVGLHGERSELEDILSQLRESLQLAEANRDRIQADAQFAHEQLESNRARSEEIAVAIDQAAQEYADVASRVEAARKEQDQQQALAEAARQRLSELHSSVAQVDADLVHKNQELNDTIALTASRQAQLAAVESQLLELQKAVEGLERLEQELMEQRAEYLREMAAQQTELDRLIQQANQAGKGLGRMHQTASVKQAELLALQATIDERSIELERYSAAVQQLHSQAQELEIGLRQQEIQAAQQSLLLEQKNAALHTLQERIEVSQNAKTSLQRSLSELNKQHEELAHVLNELEAERLRREDQDQEETAARLQELDALAGRIECLKSEERELVESLARLQASLEKAMVVPNSAVAEPTVAEPVAEPGAEPVVAETAVAETAVAETAVAETGVAETAVNEMAVNEMAVNEMAVNEMAVNEMAVNEMAVDETAVDEMAVDEMAVDMPLEKDVELEKDVWSSVVELGALVQSQRDTLPIRANEKPADLWASIR